MHPLFSLLLALVFLACPTSAQSWSLWNFCYTLEQTLTTSPYLQWSVVTQGTLNVSTTPSSSIWYANATGYAVLGATGTRTIYSQGLTASTVSITGVASPNTYGWNDNLIQLTSPYLSSYHSVSFVTSAVPKYAAGVATFNYAPSGLPYVNMQNYTVPRSTGAGVQEIDNPLNDGVVSVISSQFFLVATTSFSSTYQCPYQPAAFTVPTATVTAYNTPLQFTLCYQFAAGGFRTGAYADGIWTDSVSGTLTTSGYLGTTTTGLSAYLIKGFSGTRAYQLSDVANLGTQSQTVNVVLGSVNAANEAFNATFLGLSSTGATQSIGAYYANNIFYPTVS